MKPIDAQALARAIADQSFANDWRFYALWALLTLVAAAVGSYLGAYLKRRGEHLATKSDFSLLVDQLRRTTETAESIKAEIAHADWAAREWKNVRRVKAEELLNECHLAVSKFDAETYEALFGDIPNRGDDLAVRLNSLAILYFPEVKAEAAYLGLLLSEGKQIYLDIRSQMENEGGGIENSPIRSIRQQEMIKHKGRLLRAVGELEKGVEQAMQQLVPMPKSGSGRAAQSLNPTD